MDDALIFLLAGLPCATFRVVHSIFTEYSKGQLKGQKVPKTKKGTTASPLDLKGHNFRCLRGVNEEDAHSLLTEVKEGKISLQELAGECQTIKQLNKVQSGFVKATNCATWEEAVNKYPLFTTPEKLEPFKKLNFSGATLPDRFMRFCQLACKKSSPESGGVLHDEDCVFVIKHNGAVGIFWKMDIFDVSSDNLQELFAKVSV